MRALITGINGFVGPYLAKQLISDGFDVFGLDRMAGQIKNVNTFVADILDKDSVKKILSQAKPDYVFHLAGFSSVGRSWEEPELCRKINVEGTKNILDAIVELKLDPTVLVVSSAEVYGVPKSLPVKETDPVNPKSPYAKSRVEQEELCKKYNLKIIISRSFNHTGPGQQETFVCPEFAKQIAEIEAKKRAEMIFVGNLSVKRDFTDVRDMVRAYVLAVKKCVPGETYNICSGRSYSIKGILDALLKYSDAHVLIKESSFKMRPVEVPDMVGDNSKFVQQTGWKPINQIEQTLYDILIYWRDKVFYL